ncbi:MAG TPA: hypothetical protein VF630_14790, partial [Hymenobacter sp.]
RARSRYCPPKPLWVAKSLATLPGFLMKFFSAAFLRLRKGCAPTVPALGISLLECVDNRARKRLAELAEAAISERFQFDEAGELLGAAQQGKRARRAPGE